MPPVHGGTGGGGGVRTLISTASMAGEIPVRESHLFGAQPIEEGAAVVFNV